jgi:hypothetical protein
MIFTNGRQPSLPMRTAVFRKINTNKEKEK